MRILLTAAAILASAAPAAAHQASDNPTWIPGQSSSTLTIYTQRGLQGEGALFTRRQGNLSGGERAMSLRIRGGPWEVCDGANFGGQCRVTEGWTLNLNDLGLRRIRSVRPLAPEAGPEG